MTTSPYIDISVTDKVMTIRMNRPEKKNAINIDMYHTMRAALTDAATREDVHVILLCGLEDSFTVGNDLADFNTRKDDELSPGVQFLLALHKAQKPIIAAVSGYAVGIGTTVLFHCDLAYASDTARFRMPFINLGICPEAGSTLLLPNMCGHTKAAELFMFGDFFDAAEAKACNIINAISDKGDVTSYAYEKAVLLAQKPLSALIETKRLMKATHHAATEDRILEEMEIFGRLLKSEDSQNARKAALK